LTKTRLMKNLVATLSATPYFESPGLLLSVSGGVDSMVMLDAFAALEHLHRAPIAVLHVHHGTGRFADVSEGVVRDYCAAHGLPLTLAQFRWDGTGNFEWAAARYRRAVLEANAVPGGRILLAHHRRDQAETMIAALTRGAGVTSPLSMCAHRGNRSRPLLHQDRETILDHAERRAVPHMVDPTNRDDKRFRAAIRRNIAPTLSAFHQGFEARMGDWLEDWDRLRNALREEAAMIFDAYVEDGVLDRDAFRTTRPYLWDFLLARFWDQTTEVKPRRRDNETVRRWLEREACGHLDHEGKRFWCDLDGLTATEPTPNEPIRVTPGERVRWGSWVFRLEVGEHGPREIALIPPGPHTEYQKDWLRRNRVPHRFREGLPDVSLAGEQTPLVMLSSIPLGARLGLVIESPASALNRVRDLAQVVKKPDIG